MIVAIERKRKETFREHLQNQTSIVQMKRRLGQHGLARKKRLGNLFGNAQCPRVMTVAQVGQRNQIRIMLSNSFSFLPILITRWRLLSDEAIVAITRMEANEGRKSRLSLTVEEAVKQHNLRLIDADTIRTDEFVANLIPNSPGWPLLVTEDG